MLMPSWALGPVSAPKKPILTPLAAPPATVVAVVVFLLLLPHAASATAMTATTARVRIRTGLVEDMQAPPHTGNDTAVVRPNFRHRIRRRAGMGGHDRARVAQ